MGVLTGGLLAAPLAAGAQPAGKSAPTPAAERTFGALTRNRGGGDQVSAQRGLPH
jgi:hypothetical protein